MFSNEWRVVEPAITVASGLQHFITHDMGTQFLLLAVTSDDQDEQIKVQPLNRAAWPLMADGSQIIQCLDVDLRPIDLILPPTEERSSKPVWAVIGEKIAIPEHP